MWSFCKSVWSKIKCGWDQRDIGEVGDWGLGILIYHTFTPPIALSFVLGRVQPLKMRLEI